MQSLEVYREAFSREIQQAVPMREPRHLYEPVNYILALGGKRIRPLLTLMAAEIFGADFTKAMPAALAVELFHNFSLIHDDIMDEAPTRRGKETVHTKWDLNTGILSGDAMLILAYQFFEDYPPETFRELAKLFSKTALEVCEGQQWDVEFEHRTDVTIPEYLKMIEYKTAVLLGAALKMGGIVAGTSDRNCAGIYHFGRLLGIAFQLQDDYLDSFGDPKDFGKQVGGDIIENKKTFLYLKAFEFADDNQRAELSQLFSTNTEDKVDRVKAIFTATRAADAIREEVRNYTAEAFRHLDTMEISPVAKQALTKFGEGLMNRTM